MSTQGTDFRNDAGTGYVYADRFFTGSGASPSRQVTGEIALDGSNPTAVATGLTAITSVQLTLKGTAAPGLSTSTLSYGVSGGTLNIYGWMPTGAGDATLIASTGTETVGYTATGT
jgi:hypothetical protein